MSHHISNTSEGSPEAGSDAAMNAADPLSPTAPHAAKDTTAMAGFPSGESDISRDLPNSVTNRNRPSTEPSLILIDEFSNALKDPEHPYHALADVLLSAYEQAAIGKGKERHARDRPFVDQPMQAISRLLGSPDGMEYQAVKKLQESQCMALAAAERELLGAIVYTAGVIVYRREND